MHQSRSFTRFLSVGLLATCAFAGDGLAHSRSFEIAGIPYSTYDPGTHARHDGRDTYRCVKGRIGMSRIGEADRYIIPTHSPISDDDARRECAQYCSRSENCAGFSLVRAGTPGYPDVGHPAYYCTTLRTLDGTTPVAGDPTGAASAACYRRLRLRYQLPSETEFPEQASRPTDLDSIAQDRFRSTPPSNGSPGGIQYHKP